MWCGSSAISSVGALGAAAAVDRRAGRERLVGHGDAVAVARLRPGGVGPVGLEVEAVAGGVGRPLARDVGGRRDDADARDPALGQHPVGDVEPERRLARGRGGRGEEGALGMGEHGRDGLLLPAAQRAAGGPRGERGDRHERRRKLAAAPVGTRGDVRSPPVSAPTGADAVIPEPARFGGARLALLRLRARGRLRVEGRVTLERDVAIRVAKGARGRARRGRPSRGGLPPRGARGDAADRRAHRRRAARLRGQPRRDGGRRGLHDRRLRGRRRARRAGPPAGP